jgi:FKBP-type peptidyl-prolyl cis-trans isomerase 2/predicted Fe-Mo cluster-binding NifX family protein
MRIAIPYEEGNVFQHFGKSKQFKLYTVENGKIVSSEVISAGDTGHEALAGLLAELDVKAVICGGLGEGMMNALAASGIDVYPGISGDADEAAISFLLGKLQPGEANCDHHHEKAGESDSGSCGNHEEGCGGDESCGSGCGGCGGCGGHMEVILDGRNAGKTVHVHYKGTFNDGTQFDSSYDRGEPLSFVSGTGMMIPGFDKAVVDMEPGDVVDIHLMPEDAYGMPNPDNVIALKIAELPGSENLTLGQRVFLRDDYGHSFLVRVTAMDSENITLDANHEMAGKELNFHIELISVED